jgi:ferredoxin
VEGYSKLVPPTEEEIDVHEELDDQYIPECSRMSCQVFLKENMEGIRIEIPRSAFFIFKDNDYTKSKKN